MLVVVIVVGLIYALPNLYGEDPAVQITGARGVAASEQTLIQVQKTLQEEKIILRPQQKRTKEHKNLMNSIAKGDEVLTNGGLVGRVTKVAETGYIAIALNDTTEVVIKRDFVAAVLPKGTMKAL